MPNEDDKNKDPKSPEGGENKDPKEPEKKDPEDDDEGKKPETVPKGKFDQAYKEKKDAERRAEEAERKLKEIEEAEQREKGEYEELANKYKTEAETKDEELKKLSEQRAKDDEVFKTMLEAELENIPEDRRGLIPEDYSDRQKLNYITANREALAAVGGAKKTEKGQPKGDESKAPSDELGQLEAERDELLKKSREEGGLAGKDASRIREVTRKIVELKKSNS